MVLAVDAAGVVWLAASTRAATTTLGADSTAAALARLLLSTEWGLEAGVVQLEPAVRATASYAQLVGEVARALDQGIAPAASPAVAAALAQVVPRDLSVAVTGANSDRLSLRNTVPIAWEATTYGASSGRLLGSAVLPGTDLYDVTLNNHPLVDVQAPGGLSVNLTLRQSDASRRRTLADMATRIIKTTLSFWKPGACAGNVVQVAVDAFVDGLTDLGSSDFRLVLNNTVGNYVAQFSLAQHCGSDRLHATAGPFIKVASTFVSALQPLNTAFTVPAQIALAIQFWNTTRDVAVCRSSRGGLAHCAQRLAFDPGVERITVGGVALPMGSLRAYDAQVVETGVPAGLRFSTGQEGLILSSNAQSGAAGGLAVGTDYIRVRDPLTGATGRMTVHVVDPVIAPASANLEVDRMIGFSLQDAQGQPVTPSRNSRWTVDDPSVLPGPEPFFGYPQTALFTALRPGTARVTFTNAYDGITQFIDASPCFTTTAV